MALVFVELTDGQPDDLSLQGLTFAREHTQGALEAVTDAEPSGDGLDSLSRQGVSKVHVVGSSTVSGYAPAVIAKGLCQAVAESGATAVFASSTDHGNEVLAHAAAVLGQPFAADVLSLEIGSPSKVARSRWGGSLIEHAELSGEPVVASVAAHSVVPTEVAPISVDVAAIEPSVDDVDLSAVATREVTAGSGGIGLADAKVVVSGGRGVGSTEGFAVLEELADLLGGAVGCSRVVTSAGWRPHTDQVGQTGTKVAPDLYIACGISGATQHLAGCRTSKTMLVINNDPEASIMSQADYAVIGDLHTILPAIVAEVRKAKAS